MTTHIMLDLETLSTLHNARILAIGAVMFSTENGVYDRFYQAVESPSLDSWAETVAFSGWTDAQGFHVSRDTLNWWREQSEEAKAVFTDPNAAKIDKALLSFSQWVWSAAPDDRHVRMWGNGAGFDNVILSTAYRLCNMAQPWKFYNDRCYRTVKNMHPLVEFVRKGTYHNALDDAESQAEHLLAMNVLQGMLYD